MSAEITKITKIIENGGVVSFPTETVYALAADASNSNAVQKIYQLKGRHFNKPMALLVADMIVAKDFVKLDDRAIQLSKKFSPGPLSFVLPRNSNSNISDIMYRGLDTLSIRIPDHPVAQAILQTSGCPIVATSANPSGLPSAINAQQVQKYFPDSLDGLIDGGQCSIGVASTVVDMSKDEVAILRDGGLGKTIINFLKQG